MSEYTEIVRQLGKRVARIVGDNSKVLDSPTREDLIDEIQNRVILLIFESTPSKRGEFLEVSFRRVVRGITLNTVDAIFLQRRECPVVRLVDDHEEEDRNGPDPCAAVPDGRPPPEELVILEEARRLVRHSLDAIADERHREAFLLRYAHDWPITAQDPNTPTLCSYFNRKERQIRNWLQVALDQMRTSLGENP